MKIIINETDGEFIIPGLIRVNNDSTREEIVNKIGDTEIKHLITLDFSRLINTELLVKAFDISFNFKKGKLSFIELILCDKNDTGSWDDWSLEREVKKLEMQDEWLKNILVNTPTIMRIGSRKEEAIATYNYGWGEIISRYGAMQGYSYITIKYL